MSALRGLTIHIVLLAVAAVLAVLVWTKEEKPATIARAEVEVWPGSPDAIQSIDYDGDKRKVHVEMRKDSLGRYYVVDVDRTIETHRTEPPADAGAGDAATKPAPAVETRHEQQKFISVESGEKMAKSLAPFSALRALGKIEPAQLAEFGLDKPEGTLRVKIGGKDHTLVFGGTTPGGGDRYARVEESGLLFAIPGDVARNVQYAESRLMERELHEWKADEVKRIRVTKGQSVRELQRVPDKKDQWADAATPTKQDETAGNWIQKLERLRVVSYEEKPTPEPGAASLVVRAIYYGTGTRELGYLEVYKLPAAPAKVEEEPPPDGTQNPAKPKARYLVKSEYSRWYVEVQASNAEQVEQDLSSVLK